VLPPGSFVVVNCSSLYFWKAGESSFWTESSPRIDLIALVTSASWVVVSTCTGGSYTWFWGEHASPGGALSTKEERAAVRDIAAVQLCGSWRVCSCSGVNCLARCRCCGWTSRRVGFGSAGASIHFTCAIARCTRNISAYSYFIMKLSINNGYLYMLSNHRWPRRPRNATLSHDQCHKYPTRSHI
jgi:hypothetical protein